MYQGPASRTDRITAQQFSDKWTRSTLKERSAAQEHFIDLCHVLGESTPAEADPHGDWYCFERGAKKTGGGDGWADVWKRGCFAWEYKGKHKDLNVAFAQLQRYAIALENPPLLVVSDMARIEIHTNFTNTVHAIHSIPVAEITSEKNLRLLKEVFSEPDKLKPGTTTTAITEEAAKRFALLAQVLRDRGGEPQRVAHFLNRILFCLFAQDAKLLPSKIVVQLLEIGLKRPDEANEMLRSLFSTMKKGGVFGTHVIEWFNGNLFDSNDAVPLESDDIRELLSVATLDWSAIEPSIIGTLFERGLDPGKRTQIGAHYTDPHSIMRIVEPAVIAPLALQWDKTKSDIKKSLGKADFTRTGKNGVQAQQILDAYLDSLSEIRVLDPACGSGNFLYVALQALKDLEHRVSLEAEQMGLQSPAKMRVDVECVHGIESNSYAAELARVTVWLGEIQWMLRHGFQPLKNPILKPLKTIECRDAVINYDCTEPTWPKCNAIIGNPPFLGASRMRSNLGDDYTEKLRELYSGRVPAGADLVCYWFEKARAQALSDVGTRVGLVATNSIRQPTNRKVIQRILAQGAIRVAWSDEPWINDGAAVRVSIICFDMDANRKRQGVLDGKQVAEIYADLTSPSGSVELEDLTKAQRLPENAGWSFFGFALAGKFTVASADVAKWVSLPNLGGASNRTVLRPLLNGADLTGRWNDRWVIDFAEFNQGEAALYEAPFEYVVANVKPARDTNRRPSRARNWWRFGEARPGLRKSLRGLNRYVATSEKSKHRFFAWVPTSVAPDNRLIVFPREDDVFLGILSSRIHTSWALAVGSTLEDRPAYATTTCFDAFPFPAGLTPDRRATDYSNSHAQSIAATAKRLHELRDNWLNPPEWCDRIPGIAKGYPDRIIAKSGHEADLKKRTLTNLYNVYPSWLAHVHKELDIAVARAYAWEDYTSEMPVKMILARLLKLNLRRSEDLFSLPKEQDLRNPKSLSARLAQPSSEVLKRRLAVVCSLVNRLADDPNFGRTKMAKLFYLADVTQNLQLDTVYYRQAAGPLDVAALYNEETGLEALAVKNHYVIVEKNLRKITYRRGPDLDEALADARKVLGRNRTAINRLIDLFRPLDTDECEIVATLYACWNDRIIDQMDVSDNSIVDEFLGAWHDRKRRFAAPRLLKALAWMRKNSLVPTGRSGHTKTTRVKTLR